MQYRDEILSVRRVYAAEKVYGCRGGVKIENVFYDGENRQGRELFLCIDNLLSYFQQTGAGLRIG